jgi:opacity protein-like surface antigen
MRTAAACAAIALAIVAYGCASHQDPATLADSTTRGVYDGDYAKTTANFDDSLKAQVTRVSIGQLSDQMHALGAYQGLKATTSDPDKGRYEYEATFDKGRMVVQLRVDPNWKIAAYRVTAETAATR